MKRILTIARRAAAVLALAVLGAAALSSCKPDPTPLAAPQPKLSAATVSSLTFTWDKVSGASQYVYELFTPDGTSVKGDKTTGTTAEFTGLDENTSYVFSIVAYPADNDDDYAESPIGQCTGKTAAVTPLAKPVVKFEVGDDSVTFSWDAVENAESYVYSLIADGGVAGATSETTATLKFDAPGTYTFYIYATSTNEAYSDSERTSVEFELTRIASWKAKGTFEDGGGQIWIDELVAWSDGSYTLKNWYNVEGYDLDFVINEDGTIGVTNNISGEAAAPVVEAANGKDISLYTGMYEGYAYSSMDGNKDAGQLWFSSYETDGNCIFTWAPSVTMDAVVGTYSQKSEGSEIFDGSNWVEFTSTNDVTITKVDDTTVTVTGIMYKNYSLTAKLDAENATLTFEPQDWLGYYTFCAYDRPKAPVYAHIYNGKITLSNWTAYYSPYTYSYVWDASTTLTKK